MADSKVVVTVDRRADDEDDAIDDGANDDTFPPPEKRTSSATEAPNLIVFGRNAFGCGFVSLGRTRWIDHFLYGDKAILSRKKKISLDGAEVHVHLFSTPRAPE